MSESMDNYGKHDKNYSMHSVKQLKAKFPWHRTEHWKAGLGQNKILIWKKYQIFKKKGWIFFKVFFLFGQEKNNGSKNYWHKI